MDLFNNIVCNVMGGLLLFTLSCVVFVYVLSKYKFHSFKKTGIKFLQPYPLFGNLYTSIIGSEHLSATMKRLYDSFPNERYVAIFEFLKPNIVLKDNEIIKDVTVKHFDHFHDIPFQIDETIDPVFGKSLLSLKGQRWRHMRSALSPAFTSFKMKGMFKFMTECAGRLTTFYEKEISANKNYELDIHDVGSRFTVDVIASTVFSFEVDSSEDRDNRFFSECLTLSTQTIKLALKFTGFRVFPSLMKALGIRLLPENSIAFFRNLIYDTLQNRENGSVQRHDMIHLLLEAKKGSLKQDEERDIHHQFAAVEESIDNKKENVNKWTDDDLIAQAVLFILAGHQTTSTLFSYLLYELALNIEIQDRLREEIDTLQEEKDGDITYTDLMSLKYMDMVVSESLRKWPPVPFINRLCVQDYNLGPVREGSTDHIKVKKGELIWIPVHAIHMDKQIWPDPEKFDPERFSQENVKNINPQSFITFGSGPRSCIGSRFALLNIKVILFQLISKFKFEPCARTTIPIKLNTKTLFLESKDGYWLNMKMRDDSNNS